MQVFFVCAASQGPNKIHYEVVCANKIVYISESVSAGQESAKKANPNDSQTCSAAGESKHDDVVVGPGVVLMRGVKSQLLHALLPQVQQHSAVHHRHREAAQSVAVAGGEVLCCSPIVSLKSTLRCLARHPLLTTNL